MLILLLEPDKTWNQLSIRFPKEAKVERRFHFEQIGQNLTLIPHLLASGVDSLEEFKKATGVEGMSVFFVVPSNDPFISNLASKIGAQQIFYDSDFNVLTVSKEIILKSIKSLVDIIPVASLVLSEDYKPLYINKLLLKYSKIDVPSFTPILQNLVAKYEIDKVDMIDFLNFVGFGVLKKLSFLNNNYLLFFLSNLGTATEQVSHFESVVNCAISYIKTRIETGTLIFKSIRAALDHIIFELDKLLPRETEIIFGEFSDVELTYESKDLPAICFLALLKLCTILGAISKVEIECFSRVDDNTSVLIFSGYKKMDFHMELSETTYFKAISDVIDRFLQALEDDINRLVTNRLKPSWRYSGSKVVFSLKIS